MWCGMVACGVAWRDVVWCGVVWCGVVARASATPACDMLFGGGFAPVCYMACVAAAVTRNKNAALIMYHVS